MVDWVVWGAFVVVVVTVDSSTSTCVRLCLRKRGEIAGSSSSYLSICARDIKKKWNFICSEVEPLSFHTSTESAHEQETRANSLKHTYWHRNANRSISFLFFHFRLYLSFFFLLFNIIQFAHKLKHSSKGNIFLLFMRNVFRAELLTLCSPSGRGIFGRMPSTLKLNCSRSTFS